jgi:hypothetical protein
MKSTAEKRTQATSSEGVNTTLRLLFVSGFAPGKVGVIFFI